LSEKGYSTGEAYNATTILKDGSGQETGFSGEKEFGNWLLFHRFAYTSCGSETMHHDYIIHLGTRDVTVDVKTKRRKVPYNHELFEGHVNCTQRHFGCDIYVFASEHDEGVVFGGWITKKAFWNRCRIVKQGEETSQGFAEKKDSGKIKHTLLKDMADLEKVLRKLGGNDEREESAEEA